VSRHGGMRGRVSTSLTPPNPSVAESGGSTEASSDRCCRDDLAFFSFSVGRAVLAWHQDAGGRAGEPEIRT